MIVWDAPSHALSRPFTNNYSLSDMAEWLDKILAKEEIYNPIINKSHCDIIQGKRKKNQYGQQYKIFYKKTVKHFSLSNPADRHSFPERYDILSGKFLENYFFM